MIWTEDFKENVCNHIDDSTSMVGITLSKVTKYNIWQYPTTSSNSLGNIILHISGNIKQYVIASLEKQKDLREHEIKFSTKKIWSKKELLTKLQTTIREVKKTIKHATGAQLLKKRYVQGFYFSEMGCVIHSVEHYSYHTVHIAFWVKQLIDKPLGFYEGIDLTTIK